MRLDRHGLLGGQKDVGPYPAAAAFRGGRGQPPVLLARARARHPTARCAWMRSHRTAEEARLAGYPTAWHAGNDKADEAAKKAALAHDVPLQLLTRWRQHVEQAERAASTVAAIQLARLQARTRTAEGGAVKERSRQPPFPAEAVEADMPQTEAAGRHCCAAGARGSERSSNCRSSTAGHLVGGRAPPGEGL